MILKKFLIKGLILCLCLSACRTGSQSQEPEAAFYKLPDPVSFDLSETRERGYLTAIVDNSSTGYFIFKGRSMGYEYELLERLAKHLDLELRIKVIPNMEQAFSKLQTGEGDIIAYSLTVTKERKKHFTFTDSHYSTRQVLVQLKPDNWRSMTKDAINDILLRKQVDLIGKQVHVRKGSSYIERLENLSQEIGGDIIIIEEEEDVETEEMIQNLLKGKYKYVVADETVAKVNAAYYPDLDIKTPISFPQQIAWAVRKNSPELTTAINKWMRQIKKEPTFNVIYNRYFNNNRVNARRIKSEYHSRQGDVISPYDSLIKIAADSLSWDWRLLASQMYQESRFLPKEKSWAGAIGLMQVIPETGVRYGYKDLFNPVQNIKASTAHLRFLKRHWEKSIPSDNDRIKFILASYNVGLGHVIDARALARKYGEDDSEWLVVEKYLLLKSLPKYYRDPVVQSGYCRGSEPVNYVKEVINRYSEYKQVIKV